MKMPGFNAEASLVGSKGGRRQYRQSVLGGTSQSAFLTPQQSSCSEIVCNDGTISTGEYPNCYCPPSIRCSDIGCPDGSSATGAYPDCYCPPVGRCEDISCWDGSLSTGIYPNCACPAVPNCSDIVCPDGSPGTGEYPRCACPTDPPPEATCENSWQCHPDLRPVGQYPDCSCWPAESPYPLPGTSGPDPIDVPFYPGSGGVDVCNQFFECDERMKMDIGDNGQCICK
jgi:hypothetical protein